MAKTKRTATEETEPEQGGHTTYVKVPTNYRVLVREQQDGTVALHISTVGMTTAPSTEHADVDKAAREFIVAQTPDDLTADKVTLEIE
jgi:D-arabinose 1-dehydrogenase-like Zn-dependent alcohol dehydrogenase